MKRLLTILFPLFLIACGQVDAPTTAPTGLTVTEGEGFVVLEWNDEPGKIYWAFYKAGTTVGLDDFDQLTYNVSSPAFISNLDNGTQYALAITSSKAGSSVGPFSPTVTATPRLLAPGVPWTVATALTTENLNDVAFFIDRYVAVGDNGTIFTGEYDYLAVEPTYGTVGVVAWETPTVLPTLTGIDLVGVVFDGSRFVALGSDGTVVRATNADATEWELATAINMPSPLNDIAVSGTIYIAVGDGGEIYTNNSPGASQDWTSRVSNTGNNLRGVQYLFGLYVAVGDAGTVTTSLDGVDWTVQTAVTGNSLSAVTLGNSKYLAVGDAGTILESDDGEVWTLHTTSAPTENLNDVIFGVDSQFIAVGDNGALAYSVTGDDGDWATSSAGTSHLNRIVNNLIFITVGDAGANASGR